MSVPILLLTFNRPDYFSKVYDQVKKYKPETLLVYSDGPRTDYPSDIEKINKCRLLVNEIDYYCDIKKLYKDKNVGLHTAIPEALDWFFSNVSHGIILEDDCLPNMSFFKFCELMLEKYYDNEKVSIVTGGNIVNDKFESSYDYLFSKGLCWIWGWATWRQAWQKYDMNLQKWDSFKKNKKLFKTFDNKNVVKHYEGYFNWITEGLKGTNLLWEYRWPLSVLLNDNFYIAPKHDLVKNVGYEGFNYSLNKYDERNRFIGMPVKELDFDRLKQPEKIELNKSFTEALNRELGFYNSYKKRDFEKVNIKKYIKLPNRIFKSLLKKIIYKVLYKIPDKYKKILKERLLDYGVNFPVRTYFGQNAEDACR